MPKVKGCAKAKAKPPAKAKAKAKGKPKAKAIAPARGVPKTPTKDILSVEVHGDILQEQALLDAVTPSSKKQTELKAEIGRLFRTKLKQFPKSELKTLAGISTGLSVESYLGHGLDALAGTKRHLSSQFWTDFFKEFSLGPRLFSAVHDLVADDIDDERDELIDTILELRHDSPTCRKTEPMMEWLEYNSGDITRNELLLLVRSVLEGDRVSKKHSQECLLAVMKYIGRHEIWKKMRDVWEAVEGDFDIFLCNLFLESDDKKTSRAAWIANHRFALAPFVNVTDAKAVAEMPVDAEVNQRVVMTLFESKIGSALFKPEAQKVQFQDYLDTVRKRILEVELDDVSVDGYNGLKEVMLLQVKGMVRLGHACWRKKHPVPVVFLCEPTIIDYGSLNDYWNWPLQGRFRSLGVQLGLSKRLPWERAVYGDGLIPGLPQAVRMDPKVVEDDITSRNSVLEAFAKYKTDLTFAEMRSVYFKQCQDVLNHDRFFKLEEVWLTTIAEPLVEKRVRDKVVDLFPKSAGEAAKKTFAIVLTSLTEIQGSADVKVCNETLAEDIQAVYNIVQNLRDGIPPSETTRKCMSPYFKQILAACENYCVAEVQQRAKGKLFSQASLICGREAAAAKFAIMDGAPDNDKAKHTEDLKRFLWLLSNEQQQAVANVVKAAVKKVRARALSLKAIADGDLKEPPNKASKKGVAAASSCCAAADAGVVFVSPSKATSSSSKSASSIEGVPSTCSGDKAVQKAALMALLGKQRKLTKA